MITLVLASLLQQAPTPPAQESAPPPKEKRGLVATTERATPGYTLFAPLQSRSTYLVDLAGNAVHEWKSDGPPGQSVVLLENGHILRCERVGSDVFHGGGEGGRVREYDWDGKVAWEYTCADEMRLQHHDAVRMPNGHVLLIAWERRTRDEALAAGRDPKLFEGEGGELWPDMVLEIEPTPPGDGKTSAPSDTKTSPSSGASPSSPSGGRIVWEWHAFDHVIQDVHKARANFGDVAAHPERIDLNFDGAKEKPTSAEQREELEKLRKLGYVGEDPQPKDPPQDGGPDGRRDGPNGRGPDGRFGGPPGMQSDWLHTNAIDYDPKLDVVLLSVHNASEIWVIDHATRSAEAKGSKGGRYGRGGDLLFRWGNPQVVRAGGEKDQRLYAQHDAHWIRAGLPGAGHVLVFNNGDRRLRDASSVDELAIAFDEKTLRGERAPKVELAWTYTSPGIYATHISGAQRLPSGNTLVCAGETGRIVEVDPKGEVVWDYLNPFGGEEPMGGPGGPGGPRGFGGPRDGGPRGDRRGPPQGGGPPGFGGGGPGRGGPGGPQGPNGLFRATRYAPEYAGLAQLKSSSAAKPTDASSGR